MYSVQCTCLRLLLTNLWVVVEVERDEKHMVTILIVDEHPLTRRIIRDVLEKEDDLEVIAEATSGQEAERQASQVRPDVVVMNRDMPDCNGFEAIERIVACSPNSHVVIFTPDFQAQHTVHAIQKGAMSYISKDIEPDALVNTIRCAARNDLCIPGALAREMLTYLRPYWQSQSSYTNMWAPVSYRIREHLHAEHENIGRARPKILRPLTEREKEILNLMCCGRKDREIASELCIAESTVHKHVQNILGKLQVRNRAEAIYLMSTRSFY